ncbi:TIGR03943 family putative permease subunit [Microbacterium sp.]|uniref:TIGR03943 family putative permease subunit n=1 Tax=Microbacterium sp. TaxID=51671 RepID=UPI0039E65CCC
MREVWSGIGARLLGVGLAAGLAAVTIALWLTGQLGLYINPDSAWFAVSMAVLALVGATASCALPRGAEADHGHDHGGGDAGGDGHGGGHDHGGEHGAGGRHAPGHSAGAGSGHGLGGSHGGEVHPAQTTAIAADGRDSRRMNGAVDASSGANHGHLARTTRFATDELATDERDGRGPGTSPASETRAAAASRSAPAALGSAARTAPGAAARAALGAATRTAATVTGGVLATAVVAAVVLTPPATLSAELAMQRDTGAPPLFQGADTIALAATGDTASFGVGEWASVFATATNPQAFDGDEVTLTGFVTPAAGGFDLTRLVITHCVIDAQPASVPIAVDAGIPGTGTWVTVTGTIRDSDGRLQIQASSVEVVDQPKDPYEY